MTNFTLRQLRYFEALAQHGHFGRAASTCSVSQPALSVQIKQLEDTLGISLFERGAKQVRLTSFGEDFARQAKKTLLSVNELAEMANASRGGMNGKFRIGVIPTIAPYLLPTIIGDLSRTHEGLDIQVRETLTSNLLLELLESKLDAAIVALPISEPSLTEVALFTEEFLLVRPVADEEQPVPSPHALRAMNLLLLEEGHCFRDQALSFCSTPSALPKQGLDASSLSTLVQMVGAGIGVTLIPEMAEAIETRAAAVCVAHFKAPQPTRTVGLIWRKTNPLAEELLLVSNVIRQSAEARRGKNVPIPIS